MADLPSLVGLHRQHGSRLLGRQDKARVSLAVLWYVDVCSPRGSPYFLSVDGASYSLYPHGKIIVLTLIVILYLSSFGVEVCS